jgi:hypothetical protein
MNNIKELQSTDTATNLMKRMEMFKFQMSVRDALDGKGFKTWISDYSVIRPLKGRYNKVSFNEIENVISGVMGIKMTDKGKVEAIAVHCERQRPDGRVDLAGKYNKFLNEFEAKGGISMVISSIDELMLKLSKLSKKDYVFSNANKKKDDI